MPRHQPVSVSRAQSKNSCNPAGLRSKRDALPTPQSSIELPESSHVEKVDALRSKRDALPTLQSPIDRPEPSYVEEVDALHAIESDDYLKVRAALDKIDPKALLDQIDKPERPKWQTIILDEWVSLHIPRDIFKEWDARRREWDHVYFEYDPSTETMLIKCMPSTMHDAVQMNFAFQAGGAISKLSRAARMAVRVGSTDSRFSP
jgi:hypothetical protein